MNTLRSSRKEHKKKKSKRSLKSVPKTPLFIHIPKTAGTSIEEILYLNNYKDSRPQKALKKYRSSQILKPKYSYLSNISKHHLPLSFYQSSLQYKFKRDYYLFAVVRNPFQRIISDFRFWISQFYPEHYKSNIQKNRNLCLEIKKIIPNLTVNSENLNLFVHYVLGDEYYNFSLLDGHLIPMHYYTHKKKKIKKDGKYEFIPLCEILKFESLNKDFNKLIERLDLRIPLNNIQTILHNKSSGQELFINNLDSKSINLIRRRYVNDFKLFKYSNVVCSIK